MVTSLFFPIDTGSSIPATGIAGFIFAIQNYYDGGTNADYSLAVLFFAILMELKYRANSRIYSRLMDSPTVS